MFKKIVSGNSFHGILGQGGPGGSTQLDYKQFHFLITERPSDTLMYNYIEDLKSHNVAMVVRVCEPTYDVNKLKEQGIPVVDLMFQDGQAPTKEIIDSWLDLVRTIKNTNQSIAVHCVAGLGRAPVLVAIALMELGMKYEDAVETIRSKRRGAINAKQLQFLNEYKPKGRLKGNKNGGKDHCKVA